MKCDKFCRLFYTQTASRLLALHQIHTVLGMPRLSNKELWSRPRPSSDKTAAAAAGDEAEKDGDTETSAQCTFCLTVTLSRQLCLRCAAV